MPPCQQNINMKNLFLIFGFLSSIHLFSQELDAVKIEKDRLDSLYIEEVENKHKTDKVLHAEPLFIDLIRDLGARKGEKEWNVGFGLTDNNQFDSYETLVEYEWAPVNRLGLEIEVPFTFFYPTSDDRNNAITPQNKMNGLKLAAQYSFFVSEKLNTTLALGYLNEFEFTTFNNYGKEQFVEGNIYNPFFVAAKRWGQNFHTLIYTGPEIQQHFSDNSVHTTWQINTNFHYMIDGTRNFVGLEFNKEITFDDFDMTIRPQMRVAITDNLLIGIVAGVPVKRETQRFSTFFRLIYEPKHK